MNVEGGVDVAEVEGAEIVVLGEDGVRGGVAVVGEVDHYNNYRGKEFGLGYLNILRGESN